MFSESVEETMNASFAHYSDCGVCICERPFRVIEVIGINGKEAWCSLKCLCCLLTANKRQTEEFDLKLALMKVQLLVLERIQGFFWKVSKSLLTFTS